MKAGIGIGFRSRPSSCAWIKFIEDIQKIPPAKPPPTSASASEEIRFRVEQLCLQIDYMRMMRYPKESKEDGTYDRVCSFARQHNIRLNEWTTVEEFIALYNKLMNGEITIEQITDFITKRWIEQAG